MRALACGLGVVLLAFSAGHGATITVDAVGAGDCTDIQCAIDRAVAGDTVLVKPGEYVTGSPITFRGKAIAVTAEGGAELTTIRMAEAPTDPDRSSVLIFDTGEGEGSVLEGFLLTGGKGTRWGEDMPERTGGGIFATGASPTIKSCTIAENAAEEAGGIFLASGARPAISDCVISRNKALSGRGGGVLCSGASFPTFAATVISENSADAIGGGVYCGDGSSPTFQDCEISDNRGVSGGGVYCFRSSPSLVRVALSRNVGGGVQCTEASPTLTETTVSESSGIGMWCSQASPSLSGCKIVRSTYTGLLCQKQSAPTLLDCEISENSTGGLSCEESSPTLVRCVLAHNLGGGVYCGRSSAALLDGCTVAGSLGPGVTCERSSPTLTSCVITGNLADDRGGVSCVSNSAPRITCTTISGNTGGGLYSARSTPTLTNCIVWENSAGAFPTDDASKLTVTFSCVEGVQFYPPGEGNIGDDPLFVRQGHWDDRGTPDDLNDDRWVDFDYHLRHDSPAVDRGTSVGAPTTDLEGSSRPCGLDVDMGAYEAGNCVPAGRPFRRGDVDGNGEMNITDPIALLAHLFQGGDAPRCIEAADADHSDDVAITDAIYSLQFLFQGGPPPASPFPRCGPDPEIDDLGCEVYDSCG